MGFTPTLELDLDERMIPIYIEKANVTHGQGGVLFRPAYIQITIQ